MAGRFVITVLGIVENLTIIGIVLTINLAI